MHVANEVRNRTLLRFNSKFIYNFVYGYLDFSNNKAHSVNLKLNPSNHCIEFLEGFLLGLTLTDGYLKDKLLFNVTSEGLARNMIDSLTLFGFSPKLYVHDRRKSGWKDLYMVRLIKVQSTRLIHLLDSIIDRLKYPATFKELKYEGKSGPAEI